MDPLKTSEPAEPGDNQVLKDKGDKDSRKKAIPTAPKTGNNQEPSNKGDPISRTDNKKGRKVNIEDTYPDPTMYQVTTAQGELMLKGQKDLLPTNKVKGSFRANSFDNEDIIPYAAIRAQYNNTMDKQVEHDNYANERKSATSEEAPPDKNLVKENFKSNNNKQAMSQQEPAGEEDGKRKQYMNLSFFKLLFGVANKKEHEDNTCVTEVATRGTDKLSNRLDMATSKSSMETSNNNSKPKATKTKKPITIRSG